MGVMSIATRKVLALGFFAALACGCGGVLGWGRLAYYDTFQAEKYPWVVFALTVSGDGIEVPHFLELWIEASDLRHLRKKGGRIPENRLYFSGSGGLTTTGEQAGGPSRVGEMKLVLAESFLNRTEFPCRLTPGVDVVEWSYQESTYEEDAIRSVFFSDIPGNPEVTVTTLTYARDVEDLKERSDLDYYAFHEFEGKISATFMSSPGTGRRRSRQEIRRIEGTFRQLWKKEYREEEHE